MEIRSRTKTKRMIMMRMMEIVKIPLQLQEVEQRRVVARKEVGVKKIPNQCLWEAAQTKERRDPPQPQGQAPCAVRIGEVLDASRCLELMLWLTLSSVLGSLNSIISPGTSLLPLPHHHPPLSPAPLIAPPLSLTFATVLGQIHHLIKTLKNV
jgi:hypothetical protein